MEILGILAIILAIFFAMNVGGNNSAAEMGPAYGAGVRTLRQAVILIAIFEPLGAILAGKRVIKTIGAGLISEQIFANDFTLILLVLGVSALFILLANLFETPVATTHTVVCAIVGIGLYYGQVKINKLLLVFSFWVVTPFLAFSSMYLIGKYLLPKVALWISKTNSPKKIHKYIGISIILSGCYTAFSAGANNAANAVGPLVSANLLTLNNAAVLGGLAMAGGTLLFGGKVMKTVGKGITDICVLCAFFLEVVAGTIILISSLLGMPVSLAWIVTTGTIGLSCAHCGFLNTAKKHNVKKIGLFWTIGPFLVTIVSYSLVSFYHFLK